MNITKELSKRSLFWIILIFGFFCALVDVGFIYLMRYSSIIVARLAEGGAQLEEIDVFFDNLSIIFNFLKVYFVPISAGVFLVMGILLWICLRLSFGSFLKSANLAEIAKENKPAKPKTSDEIEKERRQHEKQLFIHLLSVLQRDGRLMDFFSEELDQYEDDQIGAAVRSIHENCKKVIDKYLNAQSVIDEPEGEEITIEPGFDPNAIKLTGNVTGDPPFKGVVRHRGWKVKKLELPTLSGNRNPDILAPAEVEIV